jgi:CubicO group peptidase (beta-lactamase class C family)
MGRIAAAFRQQFSVPASSIAISRNGQFVYDQAVGMGDRQHLMQVQQSSLFRIASVTKPITSVTIFSLMEQGKLNLTDKVFGPSGILGTKYGKPPYKQYVTDITVDHLLTHTAGGWPNDSTDPMMHNLSWDQTKLITETIANMPLTNPPGTHWAYSNFGYCVLGRVIEQVTGQPYAAYVQANILAPCGISTMQIAANKESQRAPNEVVYYGQYSEEPYKINITRMDSDGGWIASSTQLVQFLNHVAGAPGIPALLKPATIQAMTTPRQPTRKARHATPAAGWFAATEPETGGTMAASPVPPPSWSARQRACAGPPSPTPEPNPPTKSTPPRSNDVEHGPDRPSLGRLTHDRFKHDLAARVTLLELSIGIANVGQGIDLSDRDLKAAGGE